MGNGSLVTRCLLDGVRVKCYSPRTVQAHFDWIKRFIHFRGKQHSPEVEAHLWHLGRMFD